MSTCTSSPKTRMISQSWARSATSQRRTPWMSRPSIVTALVCVVWSYTILTLCLAVVAIAGYLPFLGLNGGRAPGKGRLGAGGFCAGLAPPARPGFPAIIGYSFLGDIRQDVIV